MQSVLLHAKPSPSHWRSTGFSSHFCGLSWGQGWRVRSGSGQNVDLTSHFLTQLQCATSDIWNMMLKICSMPAVHLPYLSYSDSTYSTVQHLSPHFSLVCSLMFCHQCHQIPAFGTIPLHLPVGWKATLLPAGPGTPSLSANLSTPAYPPSLQPIPQVLLLLWHLGVMSYILKQFWRNQ